MAERAPFHKIARLIASMHLMAQGDRLTASVVWVEMADSVLLMSTVLPARLSRLAFQAGSLLATLSING